ncbi:hypothetical protein A3218_01650 [Pseudomonas chlororaphis]|uniref:hypothetical protein n=1 Tax=Pseudomonas chlororaphis TaxID=587753 RepID=UPI000789FB7B|nr:hypothetical protein [Pseudomonas chlororaphis]AMS13084.1 hypothetical protein A3218_01650 [Pseudomonas chlororaphis]
MKHTLALSIAVASLASFAVISQPAHASEPPPPAIAKTTKGGGKCASGKCGTEKIYSKAKISQDPQDRLVRTRDGKCGLTAQGYDVAETTQKKLAEGVCGQ